ncbi:MAG: endonuclease III [Oscillospiraceae bacterium]|nr:endonuclease III [Oscillospiraceae bacterium]
MSKKNDALAIVNALKELYPEGICSLNYRKDYELLFSVRLSAQCTDERVNKVTPELFARFPSLEAFAQADPAEVGECIRSCGFYNTKSKDLVLCAQMLLRDYGGKVPREMDSLLKLPGIGRKTANLIRGDIYGEPGCVVADTHCIRITGRLGLTDGTKDPAKVEDQLRRVLPPEESNDFCHRLVLHGRAVCTAREARCGLCPLTPWCTYAKKEFKKQSADTYPH